MTIRSTLILLVLVALFLTGDATAEESAEPVIDIEQVREGIKSQLPPPPDGFVWHFYKNALLPKPPQWHELEKATSFSGAPFTVYAASPEEFSETRQFEMGLTIQIISSSQKIRGIEAKKMALLYLSPFFEAHKKDEILILVQQNMGDFEGTIFRYRDAPPGLKPIIVHKFILANNVTDSVHVFTFESPETSWQENWAKYGTPILSKLRILPNLPPY